MAELKNKRWEKFALLVAGGARQTDAYVDAGFKPKSPKSGVNAASALMASMVIKDRITELMQPALRKMEVDTTRIVRRLVAIAFFDPGEVIDWDRGEDGKDWVKVKRMKDLTPELRACIRKMRLRNGELEIEFRPPEQSLRMLAQHFGMLQGESGAPPPSGDTFNDNRTLVYVNRPPPMTREEWIAAHRARQIEHDPQTDR